MTPSSDDDIVAVRLINFPLLVHERARQHSEAMRREFQLIFGQASSDPMSVPSRLLDLSRALSSRYEGITEEQELRMEQGLAAGLTTLDKFVIQAPVHAAEGARQLGEVLDEADEFCRRGELLTLATPPDLVAYRKWYLDNFVDQCTGGPPVPWTGPLR